MTIRMLCIFLICLFYLNLSAQENKTNRSLKSIGVNYRNINNVNSNADVNNLVEVSWSEYQIHKDKEFFTPFYNISIAGSLDGKSNNMYYLLGISPGIRVNLGSWYNKSDEKFIFYDFELSSGAYILHNQKLRKSDAGVKSDVCFIFQYEPINLKIGASFYANTSFNSTFFIGINYLF